MIRITNWESRWKGMRRVSQLKEAWNYRWVVGTKAKPKDGSRTSGRFGEPSLEEEDSSSLHRNRKPKSKLEASSQNNVCNDLSYHLKVAMLHFVHDKSFESSSHTRRKHRSSAFVSRPKMTSIADTSRLPLAKRFISIIIVVRTALFYLPPGYDTNRASTSRQFVGRLIGFLFSPPPPHVVISFFRF